MLTVKRLYLYGVLGVALVLLLWGLTDLVRFALDQLARALGTTPALSGWFAREELSRAVALVLVAGSIFGVHLALVRHSLRGTAAEVTDERASASRATYFFLVLIGTGAVLFWALFGTTYQLIETVAFGERGRDVLEPLGSVIVVGTAWALHIFARRADLRAAPTRTAGDWLTRAYLYGVLFATFFIAAWQSGDILGAVARQVLDLQLAWESYRWWQDAITAPVAATIVALAAWLTHWIMASRLLRAPEPMGSAHRNARTRRGYFLAVVFTAAAAVLVLASMSLRNVFAELLGAWSSTEGSRLIEDIGGPLLMLLPFVLAWWWHRRQVSAEALALGGPVLVRSVLRACHSVVALVGLAGLSAGLAWELRALIDAVGSSGRVSLVTSTDFDAAGTGALALALVGLVMWLPSWVLLQRDRARHAVEAASATSRRAYLMLVSGVAVIAAMGSLAFLVWQATRVALDSGRLEDPSWAAAILAVAVIVLVYHLWQLRADLRVAPASGAGQVVELVGPTEPMVTPATRALETIEISAPPGADFRVLNAAIRSELPDGYELRIVSRDA